MSDHPRAKKSGFIECANCNHEVHANAVICPRCSYPWPLARDRNQMKCPTCDKAVSVYHKRKYGRYNQWDKTDLCHHCGVPIRWYQVNVEAKKQPKYPPDPPPSTPKELMIEAAVILGIMILIILLYLIFS